MGIKLFIGGLSFSTTSERLRETFSTLGSVQSAQVVTGPDGRSRGFGFVDMATLEAAEAAIRALDSSTLDGRTLTVERAVGRGAPPAASALPAGIGDEGHARSAIPPTGPRERGRRGARSAGGAGPSR